MNFVKIVGIKVTKKENPHQLKHDNEEFHLGLPEKEIEIYVDLGKVVKFEEIGENELKYTKITLVNNDVIIIRASSASVYKQINYAMKNGYTGELNYILPDKKEKK